MKLGTAVYTYLWECSLEEALERCARLAFDRVEIMTSPPFVWPAHLGPFERRRLRRQLERLGLEATSLNPTFLDLNLISLNPAIRSASIAEVKETIRLAADIGAAVVVISAGRRHPLIPSPFEDAESLALDVIGDCARLCGELGVTLGVENIPSLFVQTVAQLVGLVEAVGSPHCRIVYDVANAHMVEEPASGLRTVAPYLALVHYSDTTKRKWEHLPIGMGEVDFAAATEMLREINYEGTVVLETTYPEDPDGGIRSSAEALAQLGLRPR